jgi:hypothetical protein
MLKPIFLFLVFLAVLAVLDNVITQSVNIEVDELEEVK